MSNNHAWYIFIRATRSSCEIQHFQQPGARLQTGADEKPGEPRHSGQPQDADSVGTELADANHGIGDVVWLLYHYWNCDGFMLLFSIIQRNSIVILFLLINIVYKIFKSKPQ